MAKTIPSSRTMRAEFNRDHEFVVFKPLSLGGKILTRGDPFDKTRVTTRRLRQLYDQYSIEFDPKFVAVKATPVKVANGVEHPLQQEPTSDPTPPAVQEPDTVQEPEPSPEPYEPGELGLKRGIRRVARKSKPQ